MRTHNSVNERAGRSCMTVVRTRRTYIRTYDTRYRLPPRETSRKTRTRSRSSRRDIYDSGLTQRAHARRAHTSQAPSHIPHTLVHTPLTWDAPRTLFWDVNIHMHDPRAHPPPGRSARATAQRSHQRGVRAGYRKSALTLRPRCHPELRSRRMLTAVSG